MFACTKCDAQFPKWAGRCTECSAWGTIVDEETQPLATSRQLSGKGSLAKAVKSTPLSDTKGTSLERLPSGDVEVDRVLGGGFVPGSLTLLSGEPGIGKSTLVASIAGAIAKQDRTVLYISGEESAYQLADRFARLGGLQQNVHYLEALPVETLVATIEKERPALAIIDSVQTLTSSEVDGSAGSPALVRYATSILLELAKRSGTSLLLIGQVTKDGNVAGPKTLEHLVDAVMTLEGDPVHAYRLLRSTKNRFGATHEVGVFEMTGEGLRAVENPSARFLAERANVAGSVIAAAVEGSRVFLVEVQALVDKAAFGTPVRRASGFDSNRLQMLCAILSRRTRSSLGEKDVYINVVGGMELTEPAADLAVCAAILGALKNETTPGPVLALGEVGLGGEVRSVPLIERRLAEAMRLGIPHAIIPQKAPAAPDGMEIKRINSVNDL